MSKFCLNERIDGTSDTNFCSRNTADDLYTRVDVIAPDYYNYGKSYYTISARLAAARKASEAATLPTEPEQPSGWWFQQVSPTIDDTNK